MTAGRAPRPAVRAPCRLFGLLARSAPVGVILRRGPTRWVHVVRWDVAHDRFEHGAWFHGRIYERRCDLSPDGSLMIYFASKISGKTIADKEYTYAWTAVSKPPWLTALALWPKGNTWHGGGLFLSDRKIWLNHRPEVATPHPKHKPAKSFRILANVNAMGEDGPVYAEVLARSGWNLRPERPGALNAWFETGVGVWRKPNPKGTLMLEMRHRGYTYRRTFGAPYVQTFAVYGRNGEPLLRLPASTWADWDHRGRLAHTSDGRLVTVTFSKEPRHHALLDLNDLRPTPEESPAWARRW